MSTDQPSEEQLRALYEEQMRRIRVEDVVMNSVVELINQGMRRTGLAQGYEDDRDVEQVRVAIEAVRALMPVVETIAKEQMGPLRQALSQLQLAYVQSGGAAAQQPASSTAPGPSATSSGAAAPGTQAPTTPAAQPAPGAPPPPPASSEPPAGKPGEPGPAQRSGRLWIPGQ